MARAALRPGRRALAGLLACACVLLAVAATVTASMTPTETVRTTIDDVIKVLSDPEWKKPERAAQRRARLEELIGKRFDYAEMAKRALASHWQKLSDTERTEFVRLFAAFLSATYADKIEGYAGEEIQYLNERHVDGFAEVRTKIVSKNAEYPVDYRLLNQSGSWRVYDVVADGISLVKNYRGQFDRTIRSASYTELVNKLREKVEEAKVQTRPSH